MSYLWTVNGNPIAGNYWFAAYTNNNTDEWVQACLTITDSSVTPACTITTCDSFFIASYTCNLQSNFSYIINGSTLVLNNTSQGLDTIQIIIGL